MNRSKHSLLKQIQNHVISYLTYSEIGTTVFKTMAYEKKTKSAITAGPPGGFGGIRVSHGRYSLKY